MADDDFINLSPSSFYKFTDENVTLSLCDGRTLSGIVYTIDPVSYCIVLVQNNDDLSKDKNVTFVMGQAVKHVKRCEEAMPKEDIDFMGKFVNKGTKLYSKEALIDRKDKMIDWLTKNRIPVVEEEGESLCVMDVLWIEPPYDTEYCRCTNEIILNRVRNVVKNIPAS